MKIKLIGLYKRYFKLDFLKYIFGRFVFVRMAYKYFNLLKQNNIKCSNNNHIELFTDKNEIQRTIKKNGFYSGLKLKEQTLNKILNLVNDSKLTSNRPDKDNNFLTFKTLEEVNLYNENNPTPACMINVVSENLKKICEEISLDKTLIDIANSVLGKVNKIKTIIAWSSVCKADDNWREKYGQTVTYHFDVQDLNFLYIFFYLTNCNINSGAHQVIRGSHINKKFFKHLIGSAKKTEDQLKQDYKLIDFVNIEGNAGFGFVEDTSCFHRALAPKNEPRLILQFRYY